MKGDKIQAYVSKEIKEAVRQKAKKEGRSLSDMAGRILEGHFENTVINEPVYTIDKRRP